ncbi:MAG: lytic transglycosylase domain-containing protein [Pyrinomonadaceae bacterium]
MKRLTLYALALCFLAVSTASAQSRSRVFDNFDTQRGVQVATPTITPVIEGKNKKSAKNTASVSKPTVVVQDNLKNPYVKPTVYMKLSMAAGKTMGAFTTGDDVIDSYITDSCVRYGIDPLLIYSQMHQESSFKLKATSNKGARGLMQLMPGTAIRFGVTDIYNPKQNIEGGVKYMRWLLDRFGGDIALALAGYNAGEGAVEKFGNQIPPYRETQEYVRRISTRYAEVTNPNLAKIVRKVSMTQAEKLEQKATAPLTVLERNALAIRLADGRMRLVNQ